MQPFTRTMATLSYRTDLIAKFSLEGIPHEFSLVSLKKRKLNKHFILYFTNEVKDKKIYQDVKVVSEISLRSNKLHFNIGVKECYPELAGFAPQIEVMVHDILATKLPQLATA